MAHGNTTEVSNLAAADARADAFVRARLAAAPLPTYPGTMPTGLAEAYAVQNRAIDLWPDSIAGWKVGRINPPWDTRLGTDRLVGPIFSSQVLKAGTSPVDCHIFAEGFGAVEGEVIIETASDAPADKLKWTLEEAASLAGIAYSGAEIASSCFPGINDHGPLVTISDFGNNNGLIVGEEIPSWRNAQPSDWKFRTLIDGNEVGRADASSIPGGPLESFRQLLEICAARGLPLRKGMLVSTGAVTGVHDATPGQSASVEFDGLETIYLRLLSAHPRNQAARAPAG